MSDADNPHSGRGNKETPAGAGMDDVLASIRALVTAETSSRLGSQDSVLMLTPDLRADPSEGEEARLAGAVLSEGLRRTAPPLSSAPILDEEAIRALVNRIVREELQGELGERIGRNLRKLVRREIAQIEEERRGSAD